MPYISDAKFTTDGILFYEVQISRGRGKSRVTRRFYPKPGWSNATVEKELFKFANELERQVQSGELLSRKERKALEDAESAAYNGIPTVSQYGETVFMPAKAITMSEQSRYAYQKELSKWIYPSLGDLKMTEVTSGQISKMLVSSQGAGRAHSSVIKTYTVCRSLFKMAFMAGDIQVNPMDRVARPKPRKDEAIKDGPDAYTTEEVLYIMECLNKEPLKWQVFLQIAIDTGMRRGELCGIRWDCIDYEGCTITIRDNVEYTPTKGIYIDTAKTRRIRTVDVAPSVMEMLKEYQRVKCDRYNSPYVFSQEHNNKPMFPSSAGHYCRQFGEKYGINHLYPHKLRHTFASIAITAGADVASISEKLGHKDKSTTLRHYTHSNPKKMKAASQVFRSALKESEHPGTPEEESGYSVRADKNAVAIRGKAVSF